MITQPGYEGMRGFDCNEPLSSAACKTAVDAGYDFVMRYVPRVTRSKVDLTADEATRITNAGLSLGVVQHVELPHWIPSGAKGAAYGFVAASQAKLNGYPAGASVFCDLEEVNRDVPEAEVIAYLKEWYIQVKLAGFFPGLYVGYAPGISGYNLYWRLPFTCYWGAYNVDNVPVKRGFAMRQHTQERLPGTDVEIDPNTVLRDQLGGVPVFAHSDRLTVGGE